MQKAEIKKRSKELFRISMPMVVEHLAISVMGMISTMLVSNIGEYATSALGMVDSVSNLIIALFAALTTGGTIVVAQYRGRDDIISAKRAGGQALILSFIFSFVVFLFIIIFPRQILNTLFQDAEFDVMEAAFTFLFITSFSFAPLAITQTIFGLLRGAGDTLTPMAVSILMNIINLIFGIILINGANFGFFEIPALGVFGAALGLLIARVLGMFMALGFIVFKARGIRLNKIRFFKPNFSIQKTILGLGLPTSFEAGLFQAGRLITQIFIVGMGTYAVAANTISASIANFINVPGMALSTGVMILVGQKIGREEYDDVKKTTQFAVVVSAILFTFIATVMFFLQDFIFALYNPSEYALAELRVLFNSNLLATPIFWTVAFVVPAALRATGDVLYPMVVSISTMILIRVAFSFILGVWLQMGVFGIWLAMYGDWVLRSLLFYPRLIRGKWMGKSLARRKQSSQDQ